MKVGVLTSAHPPFDTRIFHKECKTLARAGYRVTLIAPHVRDDLVDGVRIRAVPKARTRLSRMTLTVGQIYREAVSLDAAVYHFHDPELIPVGLLLRIKGKEVIYDVHEDFPRTFRGRDKEYFPRAVRPLLGWLVERMERFACRWFSAVVAATPAIGKRFEGWKARTITVHNFPVLHELRLGAAGPWVNRELSVAYVGNIGENRGIRQMVEAMDLLPRDLRATLKLAGNFSPPELRNAMVQLPGWRRVVELGFLDRARVAEVLVQVRGGLVLFHPEPNHVAAQPNKLFEYMSAGIPVIASDFPLWRQIIEDSGCGLLVDPLDPKAIAEAIHYVLTNDGAAEAMGRRGREAVESRYNWSSEATKLLGLYADVVKRI